MSAERASDYRRRKRTSHACDPCRYRKVRCDGHQPCTTCSAIGEDCTYGTEAVQRSKSDMILDVALRSETLLHELSTRMTQITQSLESRSPPPQSLGNSSAVVASFSPAAVHTRYRVDSPTHHISNAALAAFHASTTESILAWPHFNHFHRLRSEHSFSVFDLEVNRPASVPRPTTVYPYVNAQELERIIHGFQQHVNYWYPTLSLTAVQEAQRQASSGAFNETTQSCLTLLVLALGCASGLVDSVDIDPNQSPSSDSGTSNRAMMELYFDCAWKKVYLAQTESSAVAVQCLFFTALFFAFLQRPIQAWSLINSTAAKCRLLLSYEHGGSPTEQECLRRIFWSCYILESDYLAELSALPQSGIADIESSVPLPGEYRTHVSETDEEQSSLYFLACISMRRLLNRAHHLLYARDTGAAFDSHQFPPVVAELGHQLEDWKRLLPPTFQFQVDLLPPDTIGGAFLRQRYLTCKSVIYRPYLMWVLSSTASTAGDSLPAVVLEGCRTCLHVCWLHAQNLRSFPHTVMIDTWICSLSMASVMLVTLAASQVPALRDCMSSKVVDMGSHVAGLLTQWMHLPGDGVSPSVLSSVKLIRDVSAVLRDVVRGETFTSFQKP